MGKSGLQEKHRLALKLIAEGRQSRTEIAKTCGMSKSTLSNLCNGNVAAAGNLALAFQAEYQKIASNKTEDSSKLLKENKALALTKINQRLLAMRAFKPTKEMMTEVVSILNALSRCDAAAGSSGVHAHYHLTPDERQNEFRRLIAAVAKDIHSQLHKVSGRGG